MLKFGEEKQVFPLHEARTEQLSNSLHCWGGDLGGAAGSNVGNGNRSTNSVFGETK